MTITLAEYSQQQEARNNIALAVLGHTYALCEALRHNYIECSIRMHERSLFRDLDETSVAYHDACIALLKSGISDCNFYPETGRKYHKIVMDVNGSRSVHCFIDKKTGEVYKSSSWKSPAKGVRYDLRLIKDREWLLQNAEWSGHYLYAK